jgi:tripartite-type tricarboxylate transporter receptor subunit TctC
LKAPELREFLTSEGAELVGGTPAELGADLRRDIERYARVIKSANIRVD